MNADIDWSYAPEGATHSCPKSVFPWQKVKGGLIYYWQPGKDRWTPYPSQNKAWKQLGEEGVPRPAGKPAADDIDWSKAPADATHHFAGCLFPWHLVDGERAWYWDEDGAKWVLSTGGSRDALNAALAEGTPRPAGQEHPSRLQKINTELARRFKQALFSAGGYVDNQYPGTGITDRVGLPLFIRGGYVTNPRLGPDEAAAVLDGPDATKLEARVRLAAQNGDPDATFGKATKDQREFPCDGYERLHDVYRDAHNHAAYGKGYERHANDLPFHEQRMQTISQGLNSPDGMAYQVIKKVQEGLQMEDAGARRRELLGALNYLAGIVIFLDDREVGGHE